MAKLLCFWLCFHFVSASFDDGAPAGEYESYVFAMEWQPQWSQPPECSETLAQHLSPTEFAATHISIHGLWPNYDSSLHDGASYPQYCIRADGEDYTNCEDDDTYQDYCSPSSAYEVFNNSLAWQTYALEYAWSDLAEHEWSKHGGCTLWSDTEFFAQAEAMYLKLAVGNGARYLQLNVGNTVPKADLVAAFQEDTDGQRVVLNCDDSCNLSEVWTAWDLDPVTLEPTVPMDYADDEPCSVTCESLTVLAWTVTDGTCPETPQPLPNNATTCEPNEHGPVCPNGDGDCTDVPGCVRCASSGYCTEVEA